MELKPNTYYWIKTEKDREKRIPVFYNKDKKWKLMINNEISFVPTGTLKNIFCKECIGREVDFTKDRFSPEYVPTHIYVHYFATLDSNNKYTVIMKNHWLTNVDNIYSDNDMVKNGFYLNYKY